MSYPCGTSNRPKRHFHKGGVRDCNSIGNKLDIVIVDPSKRDKCLVAKGPALVERAWIMSRPPAELLIDHKLVSARKMQLVRDLINCWTGEYTRKYEPPPPAPPVISNCELKPKYCMMYAINNCSKTGTTNNCVYDK